MSHKTKFKIGEFSRLMQVTVKALRHYEQKELPIWRRMATRLPVIQELVTLMASGIRQTQRNGFR